MPWVRIDDDFPDHPKLAQMGDMAPLAGWQFICILAYCNRYLTDGHIGKAKAHDLVAWHHVGVETGGIKDIAAFGEDVDGMWACVVLEGSRMLEMCPEHADCYLVHDYHDYQPSRAQVLAEREKTAERVRRHRERRNGVTNGVGNGVSNAAPVPVPLVSVVPSGTTSSAEADKKRSRRLSEASQDVHRVFEAWVASVRSWAEAHGRRTGPMVLTAARRAVIVARLKDYSADDLCLAAGGWVHSPHHRGENDRGEMYHALETIFSVNRQRNNVERMLQLATAARDKASSNGHYTDPAEYGL